MGKEHYPWTHHRACVCLRLLGSLASALPVLVVCLGEFLAGFCSLKPGTPTT